MSIAFDAAVNKTDASGTSQTFSHTCGSGSNRILFVGTRINTTSDNVTGITYGGVAMTRINTVTRNNVTVDDPARNYLYYLVNPSTGANNVVISSSGSVGFSSLSASYTGASQTGVPDASNTNAHTGADVSDSITTSVTTNADNCWAICTIDNNSSNSVTANGGTTLRCGTASYTMGDNNAAKTPAGSVSLGASAFTASANSSACMASFAPFVAPSANGDFLMFM